MLEAKNQLSKLVKAALDGEEVIIASHGKAQVKLVACSSAVGLRHPGALLSAMAAAADQGKPGHQLDEAFSESTDQQVLQLMGG